MFTTQDILFDVAKSVINPESFGICVNRLINKSFGELRSIASDQTAKGKSQNRRIEFIALTNTLDGTLIENEIGNTSKIVEKKTTGKSSF